MLGLKLLALCMFLTGCRASCNVGPAAVWPLGTGNGCTEIIASITSGTTGNIAYDSGYTAISMDSAMKFSGASDSFVDLDVPGTGIFDNSSGDYSMRFYVNFDSTLSGTILHYRSSSYDGTFVADKVKEIEVFISNGHIHVEYTGFGSVGFTTTANIGEWNNIICEKDCSKNGPKLYFNNTGTELSIDDSLKNVITSFPGTLRIGGNFNGDNPFSGRVACFQLVPCKQPISNNFDNYCVTQPTTTTSTTTTTEPPTTTTTTEPPTTTTTTEPPTTTTTTEPPTTITTTEPPTTTTTTTEPPTTTTTKESPTTTTTTESPTTTTTESATTTTTSELPTTTTTTEPPTTTTTTEQPTTTSTTEQTTTTTEQSTVSSTTAARVSYSMKTDVCYHFTRTGTNVAFQSTSDIIDMIQVSDTVGCSDYCKKEPTCFSFTVAPLGVGVYECIIGLPSPATTALPGSILYEL